MLLGNDRQLENALIIILSNRTVATVPQMLIELRKRKLNSSLQGIYRALRKLQHEGIIVKERERYSIRIPWILDLANFVSMTEKKYFRREYLQELIPKESGQKSVWKFTSLYRLNDFWSQLASALIAQSHTRIICNYHPHLWWYLIQSEQESQYIKTSQRYLTKRYAVIGGQNFLDYWAASFWKNQSNIEYFLAPKKKWLSQDRTTSINVIDDYVWLIKCDQAITTAIDELFSRTKNLDQLKAPEVLAIFQEKVKAKITLQKNSLLAQKYRKRFEKLFGPFE